MTTGDVRVRRELTEAEEQLWVLERDRPGDPAYVVPFAVWADGPLDVALLAGALRVVLERHEILRTVVRSVNGVPELDVLAAADVPCPVTDVDSDGAALAAATAAVRAFAEGELRVRAQVFRVRADRWLVSLVLHHAVCDAASLWLVLDEVAEIYSARLAGRPVALPEPVALADVAEVDPEDRDRLSRELADAVRSAPDVLDLPYDTPAAPSVHGGLVQLPLPAPANEAVQALARRLGVSPNAVLLAATGVLLDALAGADDVLISVPVSRRDTPTRRAAVGFLVHSVPVRLRTGEQRTVADLVRHAWSALRHGWTHAEVSFGRVVAEVNPQRLPGMNPLCQCEFSVQTLPDRLPALGPATLTYQFVHNGGHKFALSIELVAWRGSRTIAIEYPSSVFLPATIRKLAGLYLRIITALTEEGAHLLSDLDLVSWPERAWLAEHGGEVPSARPPAIAERIEAMLTRRPGAPAVRAGNQTLTYAELDRASSAIGEALRTAGVAPGQRVAVLGERDAASVAALVGVIRRDASFVAIADDIPAGRLASVLTTADPAAVLVSARHRDRLPARWRVSPSPVSGMWLALATGDRPVRTDEAYVVFTSGSTGEPRGVSVSRQAIATIAAAWDTAFGLTAHPGTHLQLAPFSFDVFIGDLVRALCFGGTLVIAPREDVLDPRRLAELVRRAAIDTVEFVPAVARLLQEYLSHVGGELATLRRVMVGSDLWPVADAMRLRALLPEHARLHCTYGTSETTIDSTLFEVRAGQAPDATVMPIGAPLPGVLVSVRDRAGRPLPPRLPGELWIGGPAVAAGYLSRNQADQDRFSVDARGVRWYRTGDRVVWDRGGALRLLGRVDRQTKIHGVRVDPAEIEAVLRAHPSVADAAVVAVGEGAGRALAAFLTGPVIVEDVAAHAKRALLPSAVPAVLRVVDRIPVTRHGKVDRTALAAAAATTRTGGAEAASGPLEHTIATVCADALGLATIGVTDDFYAHGASSVHLARLAWRVSRASGHPVSVQDVLLAPSVRALAALIEGHTGPARGPARAIVSAAPPQAVLPAPVPARTVTLTGVTGTLGPHIAHALLDSGVAELTCLVRADGAEQARSRVRAALPEYADDPRVRVLLADLAAEELGLSAQDAERVAAAEAIVHAGAWVNFVYPYELLAPANVGGVGALARLAGRERLAPLHHVSTRSVRHPGGYNETKAAAERLVTEHRALGLPVSVYRPGFVLGPFTRRPGLLESFLRECARTGTAPALPGAVNVVTARHVGERIAANVRSEQRTDHLELVGARPIAWSRAWELLRAQGVEVAEVAVADWLARQAGARESWFEPFLPLCRSVGLAELLVDDTGPDEAPRGAQLVEQAWARVCGWLADSISPPR
jgi:myxalamid-type nonribosomal peptide synthetase MxaA